MRLLLAANNQATRRNEIIKSYLQLGSSSNRYAPRLPQQETKSSTKQLPPTGPILGPENILKTGFAQKGLQKGLPSKTIAKQQTTKCHTAICEPGCNRCTRKPRLPLARRGWDHRVQAARRAILTDAWIRSKGQQRRCHVLSEKWTSEKTWCEKRI